MDTEEILWESVEWFVGSKTGIGGSYFENCNDCWIPIKCGNFLAGTKDPLLSQGGLRSMELDMKVQCTGNIVANWEQVPCSSSSRIGSPRRCLLNYYIICLNQIIQLQH